MFYIVSVLFVCLAGRCPSLRELPLQGVNSCPLLTQGVVRGFHPLTLPWAMGSCPFGARFVEIAVAARIG